MNTFFLSNVSYLPYKQKYEKTNQTKPNKPTNLKNTVIGSCTRTTFFGFIYVLIYLLVSLFVCIHSRNLVQDRKFLHLLLSFMEHEQSSCSQLWEGNSGCVAEDPFVPNACAAGMKDSPQESFKFERYSFLTWWISNEREEQRQIRQVMRALYFWEGILGRYC